MSGKKFTKMDRNGQMNAVFSYKCCVDFFCLCIISIKINIIKTIFPCEIIRKVYEYFKEFILHTCMNKLPF